MMKEVIDLFPDRNEYCLLVKSAFSSDFCAQIISQYKPSFKAAITHYPTSYRNNERQVLDHDVLCKTVFMEVKQYIPKLIEVEGISEREQGEWHLEGLNSRIRVCRYLPNQYFNKHLDGVHYVSENKQSKLTFMIYLNGQDDFEGGDTLFFNSKEEDTVLKKYEPQKGDLIIFDHNLWHSGDLVLSGEKYILRSDIIYSKAEEYRPTEGLFREGHLGYIWTAKLLGNRLLTSGRDRKIKIWSEAGEKITEINAHDNSIVSLLPIKEDCFVSASRDMSIKIWKETAANQFELLNSVNYHNGTVLTLAKVDENLFLSAGADGVLNKIDLEGNLIKTVQAHQEWIWGIAMLEKDYYVTISEDGGLKIWTDEEDNEICCWQESMPLNAIAIKDQLIYVSRLDGRILMLDWNGYQLKKIAEKKAHEGIIRKLLVEDGRLYSASEDSSLKIWKADSLQYIDSIQHKNFVQDILLWNQSIISVSYDGEIKKNPITLA